MIPTVTASLLAASALVASAPPPAHGVQPPLQFPSGVSMVNLNVSVMNGRERFVTDLRLSDFLVIEDGVRQEPMVFEQKSLPLSMVLLVDMSASVGPNIKLVRRAASRLIETLRPEDEAEVVQFSERTSVLQDFTSDRAKLLAAIGSTRAGGATALHSALYVTLKEMGALVKGPELRRRVIVLLSDGEDTASTVSDDRVLEAAHACDTAIYSILLGPSGQERTAGNERARYLLSALALESGGAAFFPERPEEMGRLYDRVAQELGSQYNIGYVPSNPSLDGKWRQILVMTSTRSAFKVHHRRGYYAVPEALSAKSRVSDLSR